MIDSRKVLLIIPKFYGYEKMIISTLRQRFQTVDVIYENRDWVSIFHRFAYVYMPKKKRNILDNFYIKNISRIEKNIDIVIVIRGSSLSETIMQYMKQLFLECKYIMYQWDGIQNNKDVLEITKYFDAIYTFDIKDANKYDWIYRPLFFDKKMVKNTNKDIDICFLCSLHSQRAEVLNKLKLECDMKGYKYYFHMYCNKILYYKWKYIGKKKEYKDTDDRNVTFKILPLQESYDLYSRSRVMVDFTHPGQTGFTMRSIEALGNKCKLITNNEYIKEADFYNPNNIYVYEGTEINIPEKFIKEKYQDIDEKLYDYYSLEGWLNVILEGIKDV